MLHRMSVTSAVSVFDWLVKAIPETICYPLLVVTNIYNEYASQHVQCIMFISSQIYFKQLDSICIILQQQSDCNVTEVLFSTASALNLNYLKRLDLNYYN